jgi:hypothetical protein
MLLLPNVSVSTSRAQRNAATGGTPPPLPYLVGVLGVMALPTSRAMTYVPASLAGSVDYILTVEADIDILERDVIEPHGVTELDGVTTFPRNLANAALYSWKIVYVDTTPPPFFPRRRVFLSLRRAGSA